MKQMLLVLAIGIASVSIAQLSNTVPPSGPVGIGTASPVAGKQLTVNGNAKMLGSLEVDDALIIDGQALLNSIVRMPGISEYAGALDAFKVVIIDEYGNVTKVNTLDFLSGIGALPDGIDPCTTDGINHPKWFSAPYKLFSACPDVKVGIGTSNPTHQLSVVVGTTFVNNLLAGNSLGSTNATINGFAKNHTEKLLVLGKKVGALDEEIRLVIDNSGAMSLSNSGSSTSITLNNGTGHAIIVFNNGGEKILQLQDDGLLKGRKMRLDQETWADHVFNEKYPLMSLEKTKIFIKGHGHLPNVPRASEIKKNGLDVGEMMKIQMQKIEELTLHLIALNERIIKLEEENQLLKKEAQTPKTK